jgi:exosortase/archaeosortase family protein
MNIKNGKLDITSPGTKKMVLYFFIRLLLLVTVWFFSYSLILKPTRIIDRPITNFVSLFVVKSIHLLSPSQPPITWVEDVSLGRNYLFQNNVQVVGIYDACNGIDMMFTFISIIVLLPYPIKRKLLFSIAGIIVITIANIIRICALYYIYIYQRTVFDFSHHYLFSIIMDVLIFYGWMLFTKKKIVA